MKPHDRFILANLEVTGGVSIVCVCATASDGWRCHRFVVQRVNLNMPAMTVLNCFHLAMIRWRPMHRR